MNLLNSPNTIYLPKLGSGEIHAPARPPHNNSCLPDNKHFNTPIHTQVQLKTPTDDVRLHTQPAPHSSLSKGCSLGAVAEKKKNQRCLSLLSLHADKLVTRTTTVPPPHSAIRSHRPPLSATSPAYLSPGSSALPPRSPIPTRSVKKSSQLFTAVHSPVWPPHQLSRFVLATTAAA